MWLKHWPIALRTTVCWLLPQALLWALAASPAGAAEPLTLGEIKSRLRDQREKIESLHIRVRRQTAVSVDPRVLVGWSDDLSVPKYLGTDEVLFAFKGDKRYWRIVGLDYQPTLSSESASDKGGGAELNVDKAKTWDGKTLRERERSFTSGRRHYRSPAPDEASDFLPPPEYLRNVGLAVPDPTAKDEGRRNLQQMSLLPDLLERWPYMVLEKTEKIDGTPCVVLVAKMECELPVGKGTERKSIFDKLWLDLEHGLALRKRETGIKGQLVRVVNSEFEEVLPGFWLPGRSRRETFAPPGAAREHRDRPVMTRDIKLCLRVVNQTPDELFEVALLKAVPPVFDKVPAFHIRRQHYQRRNEDPSRHELGETEDVWMVRGVGRRRELRMGAKLLKVTVDTPRWRFEWDVPRNWVVASPSLLEGPWIWEKGFNTRLFIVDSRIVIRQHEPYTGIPARETDRLDGREVEKITVLLPPESQDVLGPGLGPDPSHYCAHGFHPKRHLLLSGTEFRPRVFWFDPETHLLLKRKCGCKPPNRNTHDEIIEYPAPESLPGDLFTFEVPRGASLKVRDPQLGRPVYSEGQTEPDFRP